MKTKFFLIYFLLNLSLLAAQPIVVLPEKFHKNKVITVNSKEYNEIKKNNEEQFKKEAANWESYSKEIDRKLQENVEINNAMINTINQLKEVGLKYEKTIAETKLALLQRNLVIAGLIGLIGLYAVLKFYFHLPI